MGLSQDDYERFKGKANQDANFVRNYFNAGTKIFAILLHDPESDPEFDLAVGRSFKEWYTKSDRNFHFTTLADPPISWTIITQEYEGNLSANDKVLNERYNPRNIPNTSDPSLTSLFIAEYLSIPFQKLPAIIFTPDLKSPFFYWMPTNTLGIQGQLDWLKTIPNTIELPWIRGLNHVIKIRKINLKRSFGAELFALGRKISDLDSRKQDSITANYFSPPKAFLKPIDKTQSESQVELNLFYSGIEYLKKKKEEFLDIDNNITDTVRFLIIKDPLPASEVKKGSTTGSSFFSRVFNFRNKSANTKSKSFEDLVTMNLHFLQKESKLFLEQGIRMAHSLYGQSIYDYSPMILPFAKSFEKELSYSIVHWVRKKYDITLPQYFYEYEPGKNAQVKLGKNYTIDFNQSRNELWTSPTLGGQISGFKNTVLDSKDHPFKSDEDYQQFLNLAYQIKNIRNRACHSDRTSKEDLDKILSCWIGLFEMKYFEILNKLKKEYQG
ncbi:hypothetical protein [Algoriphagus sp.]|uniref:hypothetical protein n=1 Tax=Algoriphagus sp. TaxID=1872435 RepID=UPI003F70B9C3